MAPAVLKVRRGDIVPVFTSKTRTLLPYDLCDLSKATIERAVEIRVAQEVMEAVCFMLKRGVRGRLVTKEKDL